MRFPEKAMDAPTTPYIFLQAIHSRPKNTRPEINSDKTKTVVSFLAIIINETVNESGLKKRAQQLPF